MIWTGISGRSDRSLVELEQLGDHGENLGAQSLQGVRLGGKAGYVVLVATQTLASSSQSALTMMVGFFMRISR